MNCPAPTSFWGNLARNTICRSKRRGAAQKPCIPNCPTRLWRIATPRNNMRTLNYWMLASAVFGVSALAQPTPNQAPAEIRIEPVRGHIYLIGGAGGNIIASMGPDGVLLVDSGLAQNADKVLAALNKLN